MAKIRTYNANQIKKLDPIEHIRLRPGMYIGGVNKRALHHLIYEVLDHFHEDASVGRCDYVLIELRDDNEVFMQGNSHGLPLTPYPTKSGLSWMEALLEEVGTSRGRYDPNIYEVRGLNILNLSIVNALSDNFVVKNRYEGQTWEKRYRHGRAVSTLTQLEDDALKQGISFLFHPDYTIFEQNAFDLTFIEKRAQEVAFMTGGLTIDIRDTRDNADYQKMFHYPDGVKNFIEERNAGAKVFHEIVHLNKNVELVYHGATLKIGIEIAFQFTKQQKSFVQGYVNTVETTHGGTHLAAFKAALLNCFNEYRAIYPEKRTYKLT